MATSCVACAKEVPTLRGMAGTFSSSKLEIVGVPCDPEDTPEKLDAWAERLSPPYEIMTDITAAQRDAMLGVADGLLFRSDALPFSVVTDSHGEVLLTTWGLPSTSDLKRPLWLAEARAAR